MSGLRSKRKGYRGEKLIVDLHRQLGLKCQRVPLSSGARYDGQSHDVTIWLNDGTALRAEVKVRATGFKQITDWLNGHHALFLRADGSRPLVVLPFTTWEWLIRKDKGATSSTANGSANGTDDS